MDDQAIHVLLVEDDDAHAMLVQKSFQGTNERGTIDRVCDGVEAVAYVQRQGEYQDRPRPNVILLDLELPRMHGHEVLRTLKADDDFRMIPVVVLSARDAEENEKRVLEGGAIAFFQKPADNDSLLATIRGAIG